MHHALGEFIQQQMKARGWKQINLVNRSGLTKQVVSQLLGGSELRRMIDPATVKGLAAAFGLADAGHLTEQEQAEAIHRYEQMILLKSAEAIGVPVKEPVIITVPGQPSVDVVVEMVREALLLWSRLKESGDGQPVAVVDTSDSAVATNPADAADEAGEHKVSGGTATSGDLRGPRRLSRGSDETNGDEPERAEQQHSTPPQL